MVRARLGAAFASILVAVGMIAGNAPQVFADDATTTAPMRPSQAMQPQVYAGKAEKVRKSSRLAYQLAHCEWLDKIAEADPSIVAAICAHPGPARILAEHRHIAQIADADHYLCRRLFRWRRASDALVRSPWANHVIELDPAGFIMAMDRDPTYARIIAGHRQFNELIEADPELGKQIALHMN